MVGCLKKGWEAGEMLECQGCMLAIPTETARQPRHLKIAEEVGA